VRFRNKPAAVPRRPHPDPATELALQEILGLLARAEAKAGLASDYRAEIEKLHADIRHLERMGGYSGGVKRHDERIGQLQQEIRATDAEIDALRAQVAGAQRGMDPNDLAYLWS
jgi:uncharacterized small protein (DUF1192 family)